MKIVAFATFLCGIMASITNWAVLVKWWRGESSSFLLCMGAGLVAAAVFMWYDTWGERQMWIMAAAVVVDASVVPALVSALAMWALRRRRRREGGAGPE